MELVQNRNKRAGLIGTILFHIILFLLFLYFGLKTPVPIPEDRGATIEFGWSTTGSGEVETKVESPVQNQEQETVSKTTTQVEEMEEAAVTQTESAVSVPKETSKPKPKEVVKDPEPTISKDLSKALDNVWSTPAGGGSQGTSGGAGNEGSPDGAIGKGVLGGGQGEWELSGRGLVSGHSIKDTKEDGIVVLDIKVDRQGNVLAATYSPLSNTTSQYLVNKARTAALQYKFSPSSSAAIEQQGRIRFIFQLK
jgi:periplasmic protein TonB